MFMREKEPYFLGIFHFQNFVLFKKGKHYVIQKDIYIVYSLQTTKSLFMKVNFI